MSGQSVAALIVAVMVIGIIGAYALLYPNTQQGTLALGALLPIAGGIATFFFHTASQSFLGAQLGAQRAVTIAALTGSKTTFGDLSTASTPSPATAPAVGTSPTTGTSS